MSIDPALSADMADSQSPQQQQQQQSQQPQQQLPSLNSAGAPPVTPIPTMHPQAHPDQHGYRGLPPPHQLYGPQYPPQGQMPYQTPQPAPRQRTAIACKYCRRRKIRCTGFNESEEGKCSNCMRFNLECLFAPVSQSTQAFVPAHAVYGRGGPPPNTPLYGSYGQPMPFDNRNGFPPQQGQYPQPPQGYQQPGVYPQPPQQGDTPDPSGDRKRATDEPQTPTMAPPNPALQREGFYTDPSGLTGGLDTEGGAERRISNYSDAMTQTDITHTEVQIIPLRVKMDD